MLGNLKFKIISGIGIKNVDYLSKTDPFAVAFVSSHPKETIKTAAKSNDLNPIWNQEGVFNINIIRKQVRTAKLTIQLYDDENLSSTLIGVTELNLLDLLERPEEPIENEYDILDPKKPDAKVVHGKFRLWHKWEESKESEGVMGLREPEK